MQRRTAAVAIFTLFALAALVSAPVNADIVQPVSLQLEEQEPNVFLVQWQVPQAYPARAMPEPLLPPDCRPRGERVLQERPGTWLNRQIYRCGDTVVGREVGVRYPFVVGGQSTMIRIRMLTGEQLVHALNPGEDVWSVPEIEVGLAANLWTHLQKAMLDGARHFVGGWLHIALLLALVLVAGTAPAIGLVSSFTLGQLLGAGGALYLNAGLPAVLGEAGLALAVVLLGREALRRETDRQQRLPLCFVAGLVHGLGLVSQLPLPTSFAGYGWLYFGLVILGMDALLLVAGMVVPGLRHLVPTRAAGAAMARVMAYGLGAVGLAAALVLVLTNPLAGTDVSADQARLPTLPGSESGSGLPGSRRVATQGLQAPIQSFLSVEAFEIRHQILLRLGDLQAQLQLDLGATVSVAEQPAVKTQVQEIALPLATLAIDGKRAEALVDRIDFLQVEPQGVLPRNEPVPEVTEEAFIGVTLVYLTTQTPARVALTWKVFPPGISEIPAAVSDPEFSQTATLTAAAPVVTWQNNLSVDLIPSLTAVAVEPRQLPLPTLAAPLLAITLFFLIAAGRGGRPATNLAWMRASLAVGLLVAPYGALDLTLPSPFGSAPSPAEAKRVLAGVLPNVYRAFEFREESAAYDRLAVSVTGDTLSEIYLEHRRSLEMEERGGARARVEAVEVREVREVRALPDGGFEVDAVWVVGGNVTHFGHRHFRQNRYDARVALLPVNGQWKIDAIELFDEERIR